MKDRTPKFPGRVKLQPVAGQTDTYDMTRADDPDDTGTPFNKRTMLQDSTAQFLKLPLANPFVDDALRHMVDRITPIGTIRTSPAQSLGDAWLKCDGSMVTFENYPQLCSVLRNTEGAVEWDTSAFPTSYNTASVSNVVFFDGLWFVCIRSGSNFKILKTSALGGTFLEEASFAGDGTSYEGATCALAASEDYLVCAYRVGRNAKIAVRSAGSTSWTQVNVTMPGYEGGERSFLGIANCNGKFGLSIAEYGDRTSGNDKIYALISDTPLTAASWGITLICQTSTSEGRMFYSPKFTSANGKWLLTAIKKDYASDIFGKIQVFSSDNAGTEFTKSATIAPQDRSIPVSRMAESEIAFYAGKYYFLLSTYANYNSEQNYFYNPSQILYESSDLQIWTSQAVSGSNKNSSVCASHAAANESMLLLASGAEIWTTSSPYDAINQTTITGSGIASVMLRGMVAVASSTGGIMYHDYTYDSRLLPSISLSDDTTTFIKAKNELDVFESQQSGG